MFNTFFKVFAALVLIALVAFFLQDQKNSEEACAKLQGSWDKTAEICLPATKQVIWQAVSKPAPIALISPLNQLPLLLNKAQQIDNVIYLVGHADETQQPTKQGQRSIYLNSDEILLLTDNHQGISYFVAPYFITTNSAAVFNYIGLFSFDFNNKQTSHLSSVELGDRIKEVKVIHYKDELRVDYKAFAVNQPLVEYPRQLKAKAFKLSGLQQSSDKQASMLQVKRMHLSWDADKDGINDCEKEGSCDHTIDYTQPRMEP